MISVVLESLCHLFPDCDILCINFLYMLRIRYSPELFVVRINKDIHTIVECIIYNFFNTVHPCRINCIFGGFADVISPGDRNTDGIKAFFTDCINQFFCDFWVAPAGFRGKSLCTCGFQSITQIPPGSHFSNQFFCRNITHLITSFSNPMNGNLFLLSFTFF